MPALLCILLALTCFAHAAEQESNEATIPAHRLQQGWWKQRHQETVKKAAQGGHKILMIGDSITQGWEGAGKDSWNKVLKPRKALNLGFSGDRTQHVLWRLLNNELPTDDAVETAVIMIGTNNTGHQMQDPTEVANGIKQIVQLLQDRKPKIDIVLLAIFPRGEGPSDPRRKNNIAINQVIKKFAQTKPKVHYHDIGPKFLQADATLSKDIMPDLLHLSPKGYQIWAQELDLILKRLEH